EERQLRCFGHNLNLSVKALLFGKDSNAIETSGTTTINDEKAIEAAFLTWRKVGPIGKLRNFVVFVMASNQRQAAFRKAQIDSGFPHSIMFTMPNGTSGTSIF